MTEKESEFTRRRVLGGVATIGGASVLGLGTWAQSRDTESEQVVVRAGGPFGSGNGNGEGNGDGNGHTQDDLNLKVDGQEGIIKVNAGTLHPGDTFKSCKTLSNAGNIPGENVYVTVPYDSVRSEEGKNYDQETDTNGGGELDDNLYFRAYLAPEDEERIDEALHFFYGGKEKYEPFNEIVFHRKEDGDYGAFIDLSEQDLKSIVNDHAYEFCFELAYKPEDKYAAVGDTLYFEIELGLEQGMGDGKYGDDDKANIPGKTDAAVNFKDQITGGKTVIVDSATLERNGYIAIHSTPLVPEGGSAQDSVIGVSEYLEPGNYESFEVDLFDVPGLNADQQELKKDQTLVAMPHEETNGNETYNFLTSDGAEDGPYFVNGNPDEGPVIDDAYVRVKAGYGDDKENGDDERDDRDDKEDRDDKYEDDEKEYEKDKNDDGYEDDDVKASAKTSADANASNTNKISIRNSNTLSFDDIFAIFT